MSERITLDVPLAEMGGAPERWPDVPFFPTGQRLLITDKDGGQRLVTVVSWDLPTRKLVVELVP